MSVAEAIFAAFGFLSSLAAVTVAASLIIQSAWSSHREKARRRQVLREAAAALDVDDIVDLVLRGGSEGKAA